MGCGRIQPNGPPRAKVLHVVPAEKQTRKQAKSPIQTVWDHSAKLYQLGFFEDAAHWMRRLESLRPRDLHLLANLGIMLRDAGDLAASEEYLRRAIALQPGNAVVHYNLALTLLRAGKFQAGFEEYEWRWQIDAFQAQCRQFAQPTWDGRPLEGQRILLYGEQGAGDGIQFMRYAPLVRAAGGQVILEVLPPLERLTTWMEGGYETVTALTPGVTYDWQCPLMSLPHRFATTLDSIPPPARYAIPPEVQARWMARIQPGGLRVGVAWAGNPKHMNDRWRSAPLPLFLHLLEVPGVRLFSLQMGRATEELTGVAQPVMNLRGEIADYGDTAAAIAALDLVITVDTSVAHLAGSLGTPVWNLVAYASDWRWQLAREDTPWYPSMRIFRQERSSDWRGVLDRVLAELCLRAPA
jgi:hypothetical protein